MTHRSIISLTLASLILMPAAVLADQLVVPNDYPTIQGALDAAVAGDVILARNNPPTGTTAPLFIDKAITLVGEPFLDVEVEECAGQPVPSGAVWLSGPGTGTVTLIGLRRKGSGLDCYWPGPVVGGGGFEALHIYDSDLIPVSGGQTGSGFPGVAIDADVERVVIVNSTITGGPLNDAECGGMLASAGTAIRLPEGTVIAIDSTITGGSGFYTCCSYCTCPDDLSGIIGNGGVAVEAAVLYSAGSTIAGGTGAAYYAQPNGGTFGGPFCGNLPDGDALSVGQSITLSGDFLAGSGPMKLGQPWLLTWDIASPVGQLLWSPNMGAPTQTGLGFSLLDLSLLINVGPLPGGPGRLKFQVPSDPQLAGVQIVVQVLGSSSGLSLPVVTSVVP